MSMKALEHLRTINHHKIQVMKNCFKVGLYKQGVLHDLSKYTPTEFIVGCKFYQGTRSPNNAEREILGYSSAWLHHKGRNKHHLEYWIDYKGGEDSGLGGMRMPDKYVVEMFMDRIAASKVYMGKSYNDKSPLTYYKMGKVILHDEVRELLERMLSMLAEKGEEETFRYIRKEILKKRS